MFETMRAASGVGLAAPQIGVGKRVIVVDVSPVEKETAPLALVNPAIVEGGGSVEGTEGCLSLPGVEGVVPRAEFVLVKAQDEQGHPVHLHASGFLARALQHEIDHLDGILFIDRIPAVAAPAR
jgi:peptide deformylase